MSTKKNFNLGDSSRILKISENILKCDSIQSSSKQELSMDSPLNESEMNQAWNNIHCSSHNKLKSILNPDKNDSSEIKHLLSPPLFLFKKFDDKSQSLIDSLGLQLNNTSKVPRYNEKECNMISELKLEIPLYFKNILKEIIDPFYRININNTVYYLENCIFNGVYGKERQDIIGLISIPEDKHELKYFDANFSIERLTPKLNVKELITNQLSFKYENIYNPALEYPIINYEQRVPDEIFSKNLAQNLSFSQGSSISSSNLKDFDQLYFQKFKLYINSYEENDPSYMISNPNVDFFSESIPESSYNFGRETNRFIDNLNLVLSSLQDNIPSVNTKSFEQTYPNEKLDFSTTSFEIKDFNLDKLLRQKRELSVELQADINLEQFSNNDDNNSISETSEVILLDSPSLSPPPKKKFHTKFNFYIPKSENFEPKDSTLKESYNAKLYKDSHKYIIDQNMLQNAKLANLLSSKFNIEFIVRYLSTNIHKLGPDLIYDEDNCLLITSDIELHQVSIGSNVTEQLFGLEKLKKIINSNLPRFKNIWIILKISIGSQKILGSSSNKKLNQLLEEKIKIEAKSRKRIRIVYSDSTESSAQLIRLIGNAISDQYDHLTNFTEVPAWNSKSQWLERGWLKAEETTHERFLCSLLWLTPFTAQLVLTILDLNQLLNLNQKELQNSLGKWISSDIINGLYRALHYPIN